MAVVQIPKDYRLGLAIQPTYGTVVADTAAFIELSPADWPDTDADIKVYDQDSYHARRNRTYADVQTDEFGAMPKITITGDARLTEIDLFLYSWFESVTEGASTPFQKDFICATGDTDYVANAGLFFTVIMRDPTASNSWKIKDCVVQNLQFTLAKGERLKYKAELVGRGGVINTSNPNTGAWTNSADTFFHFLKFVRYKLDFGAGLLTPILTGFDLNFTRDLILSGYDGAGNASRHVFINRKMTFDISAHKDGNSITALTNAKADTALSTIQLGWGSGTPGSASGDLNFQGTGKIYTVHKVAQATADFKITGEFLSASSAATALTVTESNATDRGW